MCTCGTTGSTGPTTGTFNLAGGLNTNFVYSVPTMTIDQKLSLLNTLVYALERVGETRTELIVRIKELIVELR
jgi:hypothetical protein